MLTGIMSLIALFRLKYFVYMGSSLIAVLPKSHYNRVMKVHVIGRVVIVALFESSFTGKKH